MDGDIFKLDSFSFYGLSVLIYENSMTCEYPVSMLVPTVSRGGNQEAGVEDMRPTKLQLALFEQT